MTLEITADRRRIEADPDERAHACVVEVAPRLVAARVDAARALLRIETTRTYVAHQCASIEEYGVRFLGVSAREARDLVDLGRALDSAPTRAVAVAVASARDADAAASGGQAPVAEPAAQGSEAPDSALAPDVPAEPVPPITVADAVLSGALTVERAVAAGRFVAKPELLRDGEDPVALAMSGSMRQVRATLRSREEELAQRESVVPLSLSVTGRALDGFRRARSVASERAGAMLTEGQTFALVVDHWLDDFDPLRGVEGTRRLPDTGDLPGRRYVPLSERRAVGLRSGGQCEVPGCTRRTFLTFAHDRSHRSGGSRERENLWHACGQHHTQFDAGLLRICGWRDGRPQFCDPDGRLLEDRARIRPSEEASRRTTAARPPDGVAEDARACESASHGQEPVAPGRPAGPPLTPTVGSSPDASDTRPRDAPGRALRPLTRRPVASGPARDRGARGSAASDPGAERCASRRVLS